MDFQRKTWMAAVGASAGAGLAAWLVLQRLRQREGCARHQGACAMGAGAGSEAAPPASAVATGAGRAPEAGQARRRIERRIAAGAASCRARAAGMPGAITRTLALVVSFLHGLLRIDWLKYVGTPAMQSGLFLLIPAAWVMLRESLWDRKRVRAERRMAGAYAG